MPDSATGPDVGLEHQVELARLAELAAALRAVDLAARVAALLGDRLAQVVLAPAPLALAEALDERVAEAAEVTRRLPDPGVLDDRRVDRDDVVAIGEHRPPPLVLDVVLEQDAVVAVVVGRADAAVDLRRREDEAAALAERDDLVEAGAVAAVGCAAHGQGTVSAVLARGYLAARGDSFVRVAVGVDDRDRERLQSLRLDALAGLDRALGEADADPVDPASLGLDAERPPVPADRSAGDLSVPASELSLRADLQPARQLDPRFGDRRRGRRGGAARPSACRT